VTAISKKLGALNANVGKGAGRGEGGSGMTRGSGLIRKKKVRRGWFLPLQVHVLSGRHKCSSKKGVGVWKRGEMGTPRRIVSGGLSVWRMKRTTTEGGENFRRGDRVKKLWLKRQNTAEKKKKSNKKKKQNKKKKKIKNVS